MAGAGYKLFATGDVLTAAQVNTYLMEQTVMRFADSAARTTALSGVLAEGMVSYLQDTNTLEVYDGAAWVGATGDITGLTAGTGISISSATGPVPTVTNSMATEITAKGDLIVGTGSATFDNLAAGSNGETLVADSSATTGLRWQGDYAAGKNKIINGDMGVWQRGTTINTVSGADTFFADRFVGRGDAPSGTPVVTRQTFTPGTAPVSGYEGQYFLRYTTGGNVSMAISQKIEDVRTLAGQTITVSFWAKTSTAKTFTILLRQAFGSGGSADVDQSASYTTTTSWQRFTQTFTLGSLSGKTIGTNSFLLLQPVAYSSQTGNFDVDLWGVQVEAGSVATALQTATGTIQGELAACQRYFFKSPEMSVVPGAATSSGLIRGGTNASGNRWIGAFCLPVTMRVNPTCVVYNPNNGTAGQMRNEDANTNVTVSGIFGQYTNTVTQIDFSPVTSANNVVVGYITASAEL